MFHQDFTKTMKYLYTLFVTVCFGAALFAQEQRGDRFYAAGDYAGAAKYYATALKSDNTKALLGKTIDSYYQAQDYVSAGRYLNQLVNGRYRDEDRTYDNV